MTAARPPLPDEWLVLVEGALDRAAGRPLRDCPYSTDVPVCMKAWTIGWLAADHLLGRGGPAAT